MAGAWPWRVALETLGYYAAAPPPHTLAKLMAGEKLPWVVARVEKALRREDDAADAVFVLGDDSGVTMVAQLSARAAAQAGGEVRAGSVVAIRRPATLRGAGDDTCLVVDAPDLVLAVPPDAPPPVHARRRGRPARAAPPPLPVPAPVPAPPRRAAPSPPRPAEWTAAAPPPLPAPVPAPAPAQAPPRRAVLSPPRPAERTAAAPAAAPRRASTTETNGDLIDALLDGGRLLIQQEAAASGPAAHAPPLQPAPDGVDDDVDALLDSFGC